MNAESGMSRPSRQRERDRLGLPALEKGDEHDERTAYEQAEARRQQRIAAGLIRLLDLEPWRKQAACRGEDTDLFFGFPSEPWDITLAREQDTKAEYCDRCPVRAECRDAARQGREYGLWGGENEVDRALVGREPVKSHNRAVQRVLAERRERSEQ